MSMIDLDGLKKMFAESMLSSGGTKWGMDKALFEVCQYCYQQGAKDAGVDPVPPLGFELEVNPVSGVTKLTAPDGVVWTSLYKSQAAHQVLLRLMNVWVAGMKKDKA